MRAAVTLAGSTSSTPLSSAACHYQPRSFILCATLIRVPRHATVRRGETGSPVKSAACAVDHSGAAPAAVSLTGSPHATARDAWEGGVIGNSNTFVRDGLMVTPRGYANKYDVEEGSTRAGEQAGRSLSTGLAGWLETIRASGESPEALAQRYRLPLAYIEAALADVSDEIEAEAGA
jgi:hypothetical protein